jgi:putative copper export protein
LNVVICFWRRSKTSYATSGDASTTSGRSATHRALTLSRKTHDILFYIHLLAATVWIGGLIVLGALIPAVRNVTDDRNVIQAMARRFGVISWSALGTLVVTGGVLAIDHEWNRTLIFKVGLVLVTAMLAAWHTIAAGDQSPRARGIIQGAIMALGLVILGLATAL